MAPGSDFTVFYSWQADLPGETNRRLIQEGLRTASTRLEEEYAKDRVRIVIDEATRDLPGSPNIPQAILDKIRAADAFVADITTVRRSQDPSQRPCPNPNVMMELGFAVAHLGWGRVILLFNKSHGVFPSDVPFNIDRQRLSDYEFPLPPATDAQSRLTRKERSAQLAGLKAPLFDLLTEALGSILTRKPPKPRSADELTPETRKRRHDTEKLLAVLRSIHIPTMDTFLEDIQVGVIPNKIFHFWEEFDGLTSSNLFHLYDSRARSLVSSLRNAWGGTLSFGHQFMPSQSGNKYVFKPRGDIFTSAEAKDMKKIVSLAQTTRRSIAALLKYIRQRYPEIDIDQASRYAWEGLLKSEEDLRRRFGE